MTSLFTWNDTFLTHLHSVDGQHQRLVGLVNDLAELVIAADGIDPQTYAALREAVLDYAQVHFQDEEKLMMSIGLDQRHLGLHLDQHRCFLEEAMSLGDLGKTVAAERAEKLVEFLVRWLAYHILGTDQSMARQMRWISAGDTPAQAFDKDVQQQTSSTDPLLAAMSGLFYVVSERNRELRGLNNALEHRVKERTLELEKANQQLQLLAIQDDLTGLPNRRFAILCLNQLWLEAQRYGRPLSLLMLDADNFKLVNDTYGHATGDTLLRKLAKRLRDSVRRSDIVCRLGGDECLVICPQSSASGAVEVARKILEMNRPFQTSDGETYWEGALSIGVATAAPTAFDTMQQPDDLLRAADQALYGAKRKGGGRLEGPLPPASPPGGTP